VSDELAAGLDALKALTDAMVASGESDRRLLIALTCRLAETLVQTGEVIHIVDIEELPMQ